MEDYQVSNGTKVVPVISKATAKAYSVAIESANAKSLGAVATLVAKDLGLTPVGVSYKGARVENSKFSKKYGKIITKTKWAITEGDKVVVFKYLANIKREVLATEAVKGLLYEMLKAFDTQVLGMSASMRTSGFYARSNDLFAKLEK